MDNYRKNANETASVLLEDCLSSVARSAKRNLLLFSSLCLVVSTSKIDPTSLKVPFLNTKALAEQYIIYGLVIFLIYGFVSFLCHAAADYFKFRHKRDVYEQAVARLRDSAINTPPDKEQQYYDEEFEEQTGYKSFYMPSDTIKLIGYTKIFIEFVFPVAYGISALILIIKFAAILS